MNPDSMRLFFRYRWLIFWILAFGYILVYFHRLAPAVVAVDMMQDLASGGTLTGFLGAAYFYPYAIMQLPSGLLSDSWGPRHTITVFFGVAFVGSLILGIAPTASWAVIGRTVVGIGVAMLFVPTLKVLAEWFRTDEFAFMTGILMAMGGLGSLIATFPLAWLSAWIGWRFSFIAVGVMTLILAGLVWRYVRNRPDDMGWVSPNDGVTTESKPIPLLDGVRLVLTRVAFWPLALWFFFNCAVFFSFGGLWGGPYLIQVYGYTKAEAGRILSMLAIGMVLGSPMLSYFSSNLLRARKPVIVMCAVVTLGLTAVLAFLTDGISTAGHYLICLGLGCFSSAVVVIGFTSNKELFPVRMAGTATGMINLFPFAGGAIFQPILGWVLEKQGRVGDAFSLQGYQYAFGVLLGCGLIALIASVCIQETYSRAGETQ